MTFLFGGSRASHNPEEDPRPGTASPWLPGSSPSTPKTTGNDTELERFRHGPQELPTMEVDEGIVRLFAQVSGDRNPYHLDAEYARQSRYQGPIGHGLLTVVLFLSELSRVLPSYTPEEIEVTRFTAPVRFGDRLRAIVLKAERNRSQWILAFTVANQDDVDILHGTLQLRPRSEEDGPLAQLQGYGRSLEELRQEAFEWSHQVQPFPVRPAPQFHLGDQAHYTSTLSVERFMANLVLSKDSPWLNQIFALEAIAQASAEFAPGFILVGAAMHAPTTPPQPNGSLQIKATIARLGTLAHRPLDRIRIDVDVVDDSNHLVCTGTVYKESETPVGTTPPPSPGPYPGIEFLVPGTQRLLNASSRLYLQPFVTILDIEGSDPSSRIAAREAVIHHLKEMPQTQRDLLQYSYTFLRLNKLRTSWAASDLLEVVGQVGHLLNGILLADVHGPEDLQMADRILTGLEEARGWSPGRLKIEAMIEQPEVARQAEDLMETTPRLVALVNALAGHLATPELSTALARAVRRAGIDVIDGTTRASDDGRQTALDTLRAAMMGYQRKWAFNPTQLNAILNPKLYISDQEMHHNGIPKEWIQRALSHDPRHSVLWSESLIIRTPQLSNEPPFPLTQLQEHATREAPLL